MAESRVTLAYFQVFIYAFFTLAVRYTYVPKQERDAMHPHILLSLCTIILIGRTSSCMELIREIIYELQRNKIKRNKS